MELLPEIMKRRSVRTFLDTPLDARQVERIVEAGRRAPSAKNRQAWRFIVIQDQEVRTKIEDACYGQSYVGQAGAVIAICTTNIDYKMPNGQLSYPVDSGIAGAFMMLQAEHEGLGSCPVTTFREEDVKSLLSVPYKMRVVMLLAVGAPGEDGELTERLPRERIVGWEHW
ncbi:MAG: nitroreductase family protein [Spirochaeta sp.]|nr:nitroreductase family protein [Spirochaeta sp.]